MKITYGLYQVDEVARTILANATCSKLLFYGAMGVGKTTLIKAIAQAIGVQESITSPTFSIVNEYHTADDQIIFHFDFYRLKTQEEALDIGLDHYLNTGDWNLMEWPEKILEFLPKQVTEIHMTSEDDQKRSVVIKNLC